MFLLQNFFQSVDTYGLNLVASLPFANKEDAYAEMHGQAEDALTNYYNDENYKGMDINLEDNGEQVYVKSPDFSDIWIVSEIEDAPAKNATLSIDKNSRLDMTEFFRQKILIEELSVAVRKAGHPMLADELEASLAVFDAVQDEAEDKGVFAGPVFDLDTSLFANPEYNDVLHCILEKEKEAKM